MALAGAGARPGSAHVLGQHRLAGRDFPGDFDEAPAVADALDVENDGLGVLIFAQVFQGVDDVDVRLVADADGLAEADAPIPQVGQRLGYVGPALGCHPQNARLAVQLGHRQVQGSLRIQHAHAVRAEEARAVAPGNFFQPFFQGPAFVARFPEARCDDDGARRADPPEFLQHRNRLMGRNDQHRQIRRFRRIGDGVVGLEAQDGFFGGMDRVEGACIAVLEDAEGLQRSHLHGVVVRAGDGNGSWIHEQVQGIFRHLVLLG